MNALLICPAPKAPVRDLSQFAPLAEIPLLGESLVEYWLTHCAAAGAKHVTILADDRPDHIAAVVGNGARWGLKAEIIAESRELTPAQAQLKYNMWPHSTSNPSDEIFVLDRLPGLPSLPLFTSYANFFAGLCEWMPWAKTVDRVGVHEVQPGIWVGIHSRVSPTAILSPPCWIGSSVYVGPTAVIGPKTILEDRAFIEPGAQVVASVVGPDTFVGQMASLHDSLAWGSSLIHWKSGVGVRVDDAYLLCALRDSTSPRSRKHRATGPAVLSPWENRDQMSLLLKQFLLKKQG